MKLFRKRHSYRFDGKNPQKFLSTEPTTPLDDVPCHHLDQKEAGYVWSKSCYFSELLWTLWCGYQRKNFCSFLGSILQGLVLAAWWRNSDQSVHNGGVVTTLGNCLTEARERKTSSKCRCFRRPKYPESDSAWWRMFWIARKEPSQIQITPQKIKKVFPPRGWSRHHSVGRTFLFHWFQNMN